MRSLACIVLAACALTRGPTPPRPIRTFTPELPENIERAGRPASTMRLRLGRISSAEDLRLRILHRDSPIEVTPYETLRWTEEPEDYVRRAVARALFEDRPIEEVVSGAAPTLEVEVIAFEEVTYRRAGRVTLRYELHDDRTTIARGTITIERRAPGPNIEGIVRAIGSALDAASDELATRVAAALRGPPAPDEEHSVEAQR
jgi:cholesterol transport system auxiliary component